MENRFKNRTSKLINRIIALVVVFTFIIYDISWACNWDFGKKETLRAQAVKHNVVLSDLRSSLINNTPGPPHLEGEDPEISKLIRALAADNTAVEKKAIAASWQEFLKEAQNKPSYNYLLGLEDLNSRIKNVERLEGLYKIKIPHKAYVLRYKPQTLDKKIRQLAEFGIEINSSTLNLVKIKDSKKDNYARLKDRFTKDVRRYTALLNAKNEEKKDLAEERLTVLSKAKPALFRRFCSPKSAFYPKEKTVVKSYTHPQKTRQEPENKKQHYPMPKVLDALQPTGEPGLDKIREGLDMLGARIMELRNTKTQYELNIVELQNQEKAHKQELAHLQQRIADLATKIPDLQKQIEHLKKQELSDIKELTQRLKDLFSRLVQEEQRLLSLQKEKATLEKETQDLLSQKEKLAQKSEQLNKDIKEVEAKLEQRKELLSTPLEELEKLKDEIVTFSKDKDRLKTEIDTFKEQAAEEEANLKMLTSQKDSLKRLLNDIRKEIKDTSQRQKDISALEEKKVSLEDSIALLKKQKEELEQHIADLEKKAVAKKMPVILPPKPYRAMIFDVDGTLTDTTSAIDKDMLKHLLRFLNEGVMIALVTVQGIEEIKEHIIKYVDSQNRHLLNNLTIYPAAGTKCYRFNEQGDLIHTPVYDLSNGTVLATKEDSGQIEDAISSTIDHGVHHHYREGALTVTRFRDRSKAFTELKNLSDSRGWNLTFRKAGRRTIQVLPDGVNKAKAAEHFLREIVEGKYQQRTPGEEILIMGDSFYKGGMDSDFIRVTPGAHIISVGSNHRGDETEMLRSLGVRFSEDMIGIRGWRATEKVLESINTKKADISPAEQTAQPITSFLRKAIPFIILAAIALGLILFLIIKFSSGAESTMPASSLSEVNTASVFYASILGTYITETFWIENRILSEIIQIILAVGICVLDIILVCPDGTRRGIFSYIFNKRTRRIYKYLKKYVEDDSSAKRRNLLRMSASLAKDLKKNGDDIFLTVVDKLPLFSKGSGYKRLEILGDFISDLKKAQIDPKYVLQHDLEPILPLLKNDEEFKECLEILKKTALITKKCSLNSGHIISSWSMITSPVCKDFSFFKEYCNEFIGLASNNAKFYNAFTSVVSDSMKSAKTTSQAIDRLRIISRLFREAIYPAQLLIETAEKTTSQSDLCKLISQWRKLITDVKSGKVKFDPKNPFHVDLEYNAFIDLAPQISADTSYNNYINLIQNHHTNSNSSYISAEDKAEVKIAVYEAFRLLDFILKVQKQTKALGRNLWVVPNLTYGKFAVSPILDDLAKAGTEVHYTKVGSSDCHTNPWFFNPNLFNEKLLNRILREKPIIVVVDGTNHLLARPDERKSARYPDAYIGYRNLCVAINEVLSGGREKLFMDKVKVNNTFLEQLRDKSKSSFSSFVSNLKNSYINDKDDADSLYRLEFWNPGGLQLVIRETRQEIQNVSPIDPGKIDSPTMIFVNAVLLDNDVPADIKSWAKLQDKHKPAHFDNNQYIKTNALAINEKGVYLSHALESEVIKAVDEFKKTYADKIPVIEIPEPKKVVSDSIPYNGIIFDVDGTLTRRLSVIDRNLLDKLLLLLEKGVKIAIVTSQSLKEVNKYILSQVPQSHMNLLSNLTLYTARGAKAWKLSGDNNINPELLYDYSGTMLTPEQKAHLWLLVRKRLAKVGKNIDINDREAQITIRLKKHKKKRPQVVKDLAREIKKNNLPIGIETVGTSTIHLVLQGINKGIAVNDFISKKLELKKDYSKVLIVGDSFRQGGSDRAMVVEGARVISVGKNGTRDNLPPAVECYQLCGPKGTEALLSEILNISGITAKSSSAGSFILLSAMPQIEEVAIYCLKALIWPVAICGLVPGTIATVRIIRIWRYYAKIKKAASFMGLLDRIKILREIVHKIGWFNGCKEDPYYFLTRTITAISKTSKDRRIIELSGVIHKLSKAGVNPRHIIKYGLPSIAGNSSDEDEFIEALNILESFTLIVKKKGFNLHNVMKKGYYKIAKSVRGIDWVRELLTLGINLTKEGRNPLDTFKDTFVIEAFKECASLSEFKLASYAVYKLITSGIKPTKYLIAKLNKLAAENKVDATIDKWKDMQRGFKSGQLKFDPENRLHVDLEYSTFRGLVDRTLKEKHRYSYKEYRSIIKNYKAHDANPALAQREKTEIKYAAYEAYRLMQFILDVKKQADRIKRKVLVVPNLSYGRFATSPLLEDLAKEGIEVHYARVGSTESHWNPKLVKPRLFGATLYSRILKEEPIIVVVDGTQHTVARPRENKSARYPDAYVGYRNLTIGINDVLTGGKDSAFKRAVKVRSRFIKNLRRKHDYRRLLRRLRRLFSEDGKKNPQVYKMEFWNPADRKLVIRKAKSERLPSRPIRPGRIDSPSLIFVNCSLLHDDLPEFVKKWAGRPLAPRHEPAYFDDKDHIQNIIFRVDSHGIRLSDRLNRSIQNAYNDIKSIYGPSLTLKPEPSRAFAKPYKVAVFDIDGTISNVLSDIHEPVLNKLLYLLQNGVKVAIVTAQSFPEVENYLLRHVPDNLKPLLENLYIYTATGAQGFCFGNKGKEVVKLYDLCDEKLTLKQQNKWRHIVEEVLKEFDLDIPLADRNGIIKALPASTNDRIAQITVRLRERKALRDDVIRRLNEKFAKAKLPLKIEKKATSTFHIFLENIDKSVAVKYHLENVVEKQLGSKILPEEILIVGDSFDEDGDDRFMIIKGARVVSVGKKPKSKDLRKDIEFYPVGGWRGANCILAEVISSISADKKTGPTADEDIISKRAEQQKTSGDSKLQVLANRREAMKKLVDIGIEAAPALVEALYSDNKSQREGAKEVLTRMKNKRVIGTLIKAKRKDPENMVLDEIIFNIEDAQNAQPLDSNDPFNAAFLASNSKGRVILSKQATYALDKTLAEFDELVVEVDAAALVSMDGEGPRLRSCAFSETLMLLKIALEERGLSKDFKVRIINLYRDLDRARLIKLLGLTDGLKGIVEVPDIPIKHYKFKGLSNFLVPGSIRIAFEENENLWDGKVDILVKAPQNGEVVSGLGLLLSALAKDPTYYDILPADIKQYLTTLESKGGNIIYGDKNQIAKLLLRPVEEDRLNREDLMQFRETEEAIQQAA